VKTVKSQNYNYFEFSFFSGNWRCNSEKYEKVITFDLILFKLNVKEFSLTILRHLWMPVLETSNLL